MNATVDLIKMFRAVDSFAYEMKAKLAFEALARGRTGWDDIRSLPNIRHQLSEHVARGDGQAIDIANLAMMIWKNRRTQEVIWASYGAETDEIPCVICGDIETKIAGYDGIFAICKEHCHLTNKEVEEMVSGPQKIQSET